ncbi:MAG: hypothetical protein AAF471_06410 [Myxococcota bacterium]
MGTPPIRQNEELPENYKARGLKEAAEKLDVLKLSGRERQEYERYLESLRDRASQLETSYDKGHKKGVAEGEKRDAWKGWSRVRRKA